MGCGCSDEGDFLPVNECAGVKRFYLEMETFLLCINDVSLVRKVRLERTITNEKGRDRVALCPGLEITLKSGECVEIDYAPGSTHREQVYTAIWTAIKELMEANG